MKEYRKRSAILISRSFQLRLIAGYIAVNIAVLSISAIIMYLFVDSEVQKNLYTAHVTYKNMKDMLVPIIISLSAVNILLSSVIIFIFVLYSSHKVAGPIYRFNSILTAMKDRDFSTGMKLRGGDQLNEISDTLQEISRTISGDIAVIREKASLIEEKAKGGAAQKAAGEIREILDRYNFIPR
jgi:signal transduction histidine kinase